ncbi:MAG: SDR family oxidoreductase, partial [Flavobacteriaceae bacterium]|nr:SDR family oxidoreductase [Flavobacteriaceae bacterium]
MQKIVVTGSNGLLGQTLVNLLDNSDYHVHALSRGVDRNITSSNYTYYNVDLTDFSEVKSILRKIDPHIIVNTAAMTNVDECEDNKVACDRINVELVKHLIEVCGNTNTHFIHISTDFIFDGKNGPYKESDEPNPVNYYGLSKLKSENIITSSKISYTILRTILVYGYVKGMNRNNIVLWIRDAVTDKKQVTIIDDQFRMPTLVDDLAEACLLAINSRAQGIFNVSSNELLSIYEMA